MSDYPSSLRAKMPILAAGLIASLVFYLRCMPWDLYGHMMTGGPFGRDFVNFWIGGHLALAGKTAVFQDLPAYNALISTTFHHGPDSFIFSYPPHLLLALAPLALLPYGVALCVWTALNLAAIALAVRMLCPTRDWTWFAVWACLSPAALMMIIYGHFGGVMALAVAIAVLRSETRPILAGICLAALTVKPQIALAIGLILLGSGRWRSLPFAVVATLAFAGLSAAIFGLDTWTRFITFTLPEQSRILAEGDVHLLGTTISMFRGIQALGVPIWVAWSAQISVSLVAMAAAITVMRREDTDATILFVVPLAALVALPYANHYDLAIVAPALTLLILDDERSRMGILGVAAWLLPALAYSLTHLSLPVLPVVLTVAVMVQAFGTPRARPLVPAAVG